MRIQKRIHGKCLLFYSSLIVIELTRIELKNDFRFFLFFSKFLSFYGMKERARASDKEQETKSKRQKASEKEWATKSERQRARAIGKKLEQERERKKSN